MTPNALGLIHEIAQLGFQCEICDSIRGNYQIPNYDRISYLVHTLDDRPIPRSEAHTLAQYAFIVIDIFRDCIQAVHGPFNIFLNGLCGVIQRTIATGIELSISAR